MEHYVAIIPIEIEQTTGTYVGELMIYKYINICVSIFSALNGSTTLIGEIENNDTIEEFVNGKTFKLGCYYDIDGDKHWVLRDDTNMPVVEVYADRLPIQHQDYIANRYFEAISSEVILK